MRYWRCVKVVGKPPNWIGSNRDGAESLTVNPVTQGSCVVKWRGERGNMQEECTAIGKWSETRRGVRYGRSAAAMLLVTCGGFRWLKASRILKKLCSRWRGPSLFTTLI